MPAKSQPKLVERTEALQVLQGFNPWWSGRPSSVPKFHRLAFEACRSYLAKELKRALLLSGPRRVGKTTILGQLAAAALADRRDAKSILYLSLDHPLLKLMRLTEALSLFHETIWPEGRPALLLLDEVQYTKDWETEVKLLVDRHPEYRIVATGSASAVHRERLAESGVGRWLTVPVPTLSFYEFAHIRGDATPPVPSSLKPSDLFTAPEGERLKVAAQLRVLLPAFQRYLLVGGFPETAMLQDTQLCQRLLREDVVDRVLKRDMTALFGVRNVDDLEKLFIYLCLHTGGILGHKTVADALQTSTATVTNYLGFLEAANLVYRVPPLETGGKRILKARNKYYLVDAALRNAVLLRGEEVLGNPTEMGAIVETTVLRHLFDYYYQDTPQIGYWRDASHHEREVDIVVRSPKYSLPFEVKYRDRVDLGADSGLASFCLTEGPSQAYLVTKAETDFGLSKLNGVPLLRIPAHILTYLLGQAERHLWSSIHKT